MKPYISCGEGTFMGFAFLVILVAGGAAAFAIARSNKKHEEAARQSELEIVAKASEEDVTQFGEEVRALDLETAGVDLGDGGRQDYQKAISSYDLAKDLLSKVTRPEDIRHVTEALEDGRYAASCVRARVEGKPLPTRRPPCFFNPQHGPSVEDIDWAPAGGQPRPIPVCAADAERVAVGAEPSVRKVMLADGMSRRAYWEAGPAYAEYNRGYYSNYAGSGMLPGVLMGAMLMGPMMGGMGAWDGSYADGYQDGLAADGGVGDAGDMGGDMGDFGGGFGDFDFGF
ncbi:hypothetical protein [Brevibacterium sp. HMSC22B09]|nr:hypothetical protein [Brevibacterium sp. HMSC22B09]